jgi:hypothetical protein
MTSSPAHLLGGEVVRVSFEPEAMAEFRSILHGDRPAVIDGLLNLSPDLARWTPEFLAERYGERSVRVYDASFGEPGSNYMGSISSMSFAEFLNAIFGAGRDLRMFLHNVRAGFPEMLEDVVFPEAGLRFSRNFVYSFFGCRGATTPLHYDIDMGCVLHTVLHGRRRIRLFALDQSTRLYRHPFTVRSYVDLDRPDFQAHRALSAAQGAEVILEPGQTLFMPAGCWHEFHYLEPGFGLSLRASSPRLKDRAAGALNLLLLSPTDRLMNKLSPQAWFKWKQSIASRRAAAHLETSGQA